MSIDLHVVFVSPYGHRGAHSGARKRVESLAQALVELGAGIRVTCLSPWPPSCGAAHVPFGLDGSLGAKAMSLAKLSGMLRRLKADLVISESPLVPRAGSRAKVLHLIHDAKFATGHARRRGRLAHLLHWLSARMADEVVTVSRSERERLSDALRIDSGRIRVSSNGLAPAWFDTPLPGNDEERRFDFLYVSNFAAHKGHLDLLRCLVGTPWRVAFVGADFGERPRCEAVCRERGIDATFLSNLSETALIATYDAARSFVFPSRLEGFGMPFLEARARGLPVLANDIPVFAELASEVGGTLVDFGDEAAARARLACVLREPRIRPDLDGYTWRSIAAALLREAERG
jgi:glycosyltransferase involved in cell wall biosynthesis